MSKVTWIGGQSANDSVGWLAEHLDKGTTKIVVSVIDADGVMDQEYFGDVSVSDVHLLGALLCRRVMDHLTGADEE